MSDIGFRIVKKGYNALSPTTQQTAFSSSFPMDKILFQFSGAANATKVHGQSYKPTVLSWYSGGVKGDTYIDNNQITLPVSGANNTIVLMQQGS